MGKVKPRITVQKYSKKTFEISPTSRPFYIPQKAKEGSIGYDLVCPVDFNVPAHSRNPHCADVILFHDRSILLRGRKAYLQKSWRWFWQ